MGGLPSAVVQSEVWGRVVGLMYVNGVYENTPTGKAARVAVGEAVKKLRVAHRALVTAEQAVADAHAAVQEDTHGIA